MRGVGKTLDELAKEIPHLLVVAALLIILLFVVTKFKWVHCSQVPQWCNVYCELNGKSQVAVISGNPGDPGIGDAAGFRLQALNDRQFTYIAPFQASQITAGLLEDYELVVLTHWKQVTLKQAIALRDYLNKGGSILWEGDAASEYVTTPEDESYALAENVSKPGFYEEYKKLLNKTQGFGLLGDVLGVKYVKTHSRTGGLKYQSVKDNHLMVSGVHNFQLQPIVFAEVTENPAALTKIAELNETSTGKLYPALLERKYVGRIVYTAVPLEFIGSKTLTTNVLDYLVSC